MRTRLLACLVVVLAGVAASAARAGETEACASFDWPLQRELAWFSAPDLPRLASGATLPPEMPGAVLALSAEAQARLPLTPSREPKPETRGGVLEIPAPLMPGIYQVTLSEKAWIDVSQDGTTTRPPLASTRRQGCPGIAKSVRFQLGTRPVTIVVSGAEADSIRIAVAPAE